VALPTPETGLVISYAYLWHSEALQGRIDGAKDRPCQLRETTRQGELQVGVAPITHSDPGSDDEAIEIPQAVRQDLG